VLLAATTGGRPSVRPSGAGIDDRRATGRIPSLDGLRALSIAGVLGVHLGLGHVPGGHLSVSVLTGRPRGCRSRSARSVLFGYLITAQLRAEYQRSGRLDPAPSTGDEQRVCSRRWASS
jgi:peptidoglycan/LPS O-acetylase OafA/YrhL